MKLKQLVSTAALLGLIGTTAIAAPANEPTLYGGGYIWNNVIDKARDSSYPVALLQEDQTSVTGILYATGNYRSKHSGYSDTTSGNDVYNFSLATSEVYLDSQLNSWIRAHLTLTYQSNFTQGTYYPPSSLFFSEAYAVMYNGGNYYAKVGRQYINFGNYLHDSVSSTLPEQFTNINQTAITVGAVNMNGFYANASIFNGQPYGDTATFDNAPNNQYQAHGYTAELGYMQEMASTGYNMYVDYVDNIADNINVGNYFSPVQEGVYMTKAVPAIAAHIDYHTGPIDVLADYFTVTDAFDVSDWSYYSAAGASATGAKPSAYSVEGSYAFNWMNKIHSVTLGYEGSSQAVGFNGNSGFPMPESRILAQTGVTVSPNVSMQIEYDYDTDYSKGISGAIGFESVPVEGTGLTNSTLTARLKIFF